MLNGVRAFDQFAQSQNEYGADIVIDRSIGLLMIELIEQWKDHLNATDGMQRGIDRMGHHGPHVAQHLRMCVVHEVRDVALRSGLQDEFFLAGRWVVGEDDGAGQFAVVHRLALRFREDVRTFILELEQILVSRSHFIEALNDHRFQVLTEEIERGQLAGEARQVVAVRRTTDVTLIEHVATFDAPWKISDGHLLAVDVTLHTAFAPTLVLVSECYHVPLKGKGNRFEITMTVRLRRHDKDRKIERRYLLALTSRTRNSYWMQC